MATANVNGVNLAWQQFGDGPDVVLVHGLAASRAFWFLHYAVPLSRRYRVTLFDLRGHGYSERPQSGYDAVTMAGDLAGLLDHLGIERCDLIGHSYGGSVALEYAAEASYAPMVSLRGGRWKFTRCALDPDQLFDLEADPHELKNLAADPAHAETLKHFSDIADVRWNLEQFDAQVRESQARRWVVDEALRQGGYYPWDYQPLQKASERYMRNHMDLNVLEERQRFPRGE